MDIFLALVIKMLPLYAIMGAGYAIGRKFPDAVAAISNTQIMLVSPIVLATSIAGLSFRGEYLLLPCLFFIVCCTMALLTRRLATCMGPARNLLAFACGSANNGYFGVPVALILFDEHMIGLFMLAGLGFIFFENTLGYYLIARGRFTIRESLARLVRLPPLHGAVIGVVLSILALRIPEFLAPAVRDFRGAYVVFGALIIGLGLSRVKSLRGDRHFAGWTIIMKFAAWPVAVAGLVWADTHFFQIFDGEVHHMMMLLGLLPIPANTVAYAIQLEAGAEKAAVAVFINTVLALIYIPAMVLILGLA